MTQLATALLYVAAAMLVGFAISSRSRVVTAAGAALGTTLIAAALFLMWVS